jgi:UDP-glucuronate 4-epimerase
VATQTPIMVTGAGGLIGHSLVRRLRSAGRSVLAVDRVPAAADAGLDVSIAELTDIHRINALAAAGIDGIIHCGGISGPMLGRDHPAGMVAVNVGGTVNLLEAARLFAARRFVFCSSIVAYGATPAGQEVVDESEPLTATDMYGASKAAADLLVRAYAGQHGVDARVGRIGWVYGPRRRTPSVVGRLLRAALAGTPLTLEDDGSYPLQLVHVDDVVMALIALYDADGAAGRAFNITAGVQTPLAELASTIAAIVPGAEFRFTPGQSMSDVAQGRFNVAALQGLGWRPALGLTDGIATYADWLSKNPY